MSWNSRQAEQAKLSALDPCHFKFEASCYPILRFRVHRNAADRERPGVSIPSFRFCGRVPHGTQADPVPLCRARMLEGKGNFGFDAGRKEYVDLVGAGIIDPTKVVRIALENAVSVASVLLLTEATMTEIPEEKKERFPEPEMAA